jgi:hypothetical protein
MIYLYMHMYTHTHTYTHTYTNTNTHTYTHAHTHYCLYVTIIQYILYISRRTLYHFHITYSYIYIYICAKYFNFLCIWLRKCDFLTEKLGFKFNPANPDLDPKWFIPDPNPDPEPAKSSGSDRIQIRIHNTANKSIYCSRITLHCLPSKVRLSLQSSIMIPHRSGVRPRWFWINNVSFSNSFIYSTVI